MKPLHHKTTNPRVGKYTADNLVLISAAQLPIKRRWEQLAGPVFGYQALFIVPEGETQLKQVMRRLVPELRARGRHIAAISTPGVRPV